MPKPPLGRGGGSASALTERLSPAVAHGQAPLRTTSQSASQTAPLVGEPLAKPFTLRGLPKPLPLGEVALRSNDGEGKPGMKEPQAQRWAGFLSERYYRCGWDSPSAALPSQSGLRPPAPPKGEPLTERLFPNLFREFVENARLKRKEFVNVIKMRRRY